MQVLTVPMRLELELLAPDYFYMLSKAKPSRYLEKAIQPHFENIYITASAPNLFRLYNSGALPEYIRDVDLCIANYYRGLRLGYVLPRFP